MKKSVIFWSVLFAITAFSCTSSDNGPKIDFTGITKMDNFGTIQGDADSTDWRIDDTWVGKEKALFADSLATGCKAENFKAMFYPNPCRTKSTLYFIKDPETMVSVRLVDKDFNVVMSKDNILHTTLAFDLSSYKTDDTLRLYYKFMTKKRCEFKGHGDIVVNPYK